MGVWYYSSVGKKIIGLSVIFSIVLTTGLILLLAYGLHLNQLNIPLFISTGLLPLMMYLIPAGLFMVFLKKILKTNNIEIILALTTMIFTSYIVMSIIGIWFRGEGMLLVF